jgi:hypothetical protein
VFLFLIVEISVHPRSVLKTCISNQSLILYVLFKGASLNEPDPSDPFTARFDVIYHLRLCFLSALFHSHFWVKIYKNLPLLAVCSAHLVLVDMTTLILFGTQCKL